MTHEHTDQESLRSCPKHEENGHWIDDLAYTQEEDRLPIPDHAPRYDDMVRMIQANMPEGNPSVYRFALVFVDGETGGINALTSMGQDTAASINLLANAIRLVAFQDMRTERAISRTVSRIFSGLQMPQMPPEMQDFPMPDLGEVSDDRTAGPYL